MTTGGEGRELKSTLIDSSNPYKSCVTSKDKSDWFEVGRRILVPQIICSIPAKDYRYTLWRQERLQDNRHIWGQVNGVGVHVLKCESPVLDFFPFSALRMLAASRTAAPVSSIATTTRQENKDSIPGK